MFLLALVGAVLVTCVFFIAATISLARYVYRSATHGTPGQQVTPPPAVPWGSIAGFGFTGAVLLYAYAHLMYAPGLFPDKTCWARVGARVHPDSHETLPLSTVCGGIEIVPQWVNPSLAALLITAAATLFVKLVMRRRLVSARARAHAPAGRN